MVTEVQSGVGDAYGARYGRIVFLLGMVVGLLLVLVGWRAQGFVRNIDDPYGFVDMGKSLAHGQGFARYGIVLSRKAPLYPLMIGAVFTLCGDRPQIIQFLQCLMLGGTCALTYDLGRRLFTPRAGLFAGILCALSPGMLRYVADFHLEMFLTFLFTLTVWASARLEARPTIVNGALFGLAAGFASLTKPVIVLYPLIFALWWASKWLPEALGSRIIVKTSATPQAGIAPDNGMGPMNMPMQYLAALVIAFVCMGAVILPWTYRNYRATGGKFVLITTGLADAMLRGYIFSKSEYATLKLPPYTDAEIECNQWFQELCRQKGAVWGANDLETEAILSGAAKAKLAAEPGQFVRKFVTGIFTFWYEMTSRLNSLVAGLAALCAWTLAVIGYRRARKERRPAWLLLLPPLYLNLLLAALLALGRYSIPVMPTLLTLAAFGMDTILPQRDVAVT